MNWGIDLNITRARSDMKSILLLVLIIYRQFAQNCGICMYHVTQAGCKNSIVYVIAQGFN